MGDTSGVGNLLTVADIAARLGTRKARVHHLILSRRIDADATVAGVRLFHPRIVGRLRDELAAIDKRRDGSRPRAPQCA